MPEDIGALYPTKMPLLSETANIQEALRVYHYGKPSGTGLGQYDPTNTDPGNLNPTGTTPSIAHYLYNLQDQITTISGTLGVQTSVWTTKGDLVTRTSSPGVLRLGVGTDGSVLTANSATATGLEWATPTVTPTNSVTLTNKTLTAPKITSASSILDANGNSLISFPASISSAVNQLTIVNAIATEKPTISATGADTNISLNLVSKGSGTVQANGVEVTTTSGTQTLTNKTLTAPTATQLYLSDSVVVFEGSSADDFETILTVVNPTADRTVTIPDATTTLVGTDTAQTLTNKTLTAPTVSQLYLSDSSIIFEGSFDDAFETTLTASNPSSDITITLPNATTTLVGTNAYQSLDNKTLNSPIFTGSSREKVTAVPNNVAGYSFYTIDNAVQWITGSGTNSGGVNIRYSAGNTLNSVMSITESMTIVLMVTNGVTPWLPSFWQIDGTAITPKWINGNTPVAGNASAIDVYSLTIIKTANATFTMLASQVKYS